METITIGLTNKRTKIKIGMREMKEMNTEKMKITKKK